MLFTSEQKFSDSNIVVIWWGCWLLFYILLPYSPKCVQQTAKDNQMEFIKWARLHFVRIIYHWKWLICLIHINWMKNFSSFHFRRFICHFAFVYSIRFDVRSPLRLCQWLCSCVDCVIVCQPSYFQVVLYCWGQPILLLAHTTSQT